MALDPGIWIPQRGGRLSAGCGAGEAKGRRGQGSRGRFASPPRAGMALGGSKTAWEKAIGPVRGTRGAVRGCEGGAGREGLRRWAPCADGAALFEEEGAGKREWWAGCEHQSLRGLAASPPGLREMAEFLAGPGATPLPVIPGALTRFCAELADGHRARSLRPPSPLPGLPTSAKSSFLCS